MRRYWGKSILLFTMIFLILSCLGCGRDNTGKIKEKLSQGDYSGAYEIANDSQSEGILEENIIACLSELLAKTSSNPSTFVLRDAWFEDNEKQKPTIVIYFQQEYNSRAVSMYFLYKFMGKKYSYELLSTLSSDSKDDGYTVGIKGLVKKIVTNENDKTHRLNKDSIDNINSLCEQSLLYNVEMLSDNESVYGSIY